MIYAIFLFAIVVCLSVIIEIIVHKTLVNKEIVRNGLSAYEIAVSEGYTGSVQEWLDSLTGKSAFEIATEYGYDGTEEEYGQLRRDLSRVFSA